MFVPTGAKFIVQVMVFPVQDPDSGPLGTATMQKNYNAIGRGTIM